MECATVMSTGQIRGMIPVRLWLDEPERYHGVTAADTNSTQALHQRNGYDNNPYHNHCVSPPDDVYLEPELHPRASRAPNGPQEGRQGSRHEKQPSMLTRRLQHAPHQNGKGLERHGAFLPRAHGDSHHFGVACNRFPWDPTVLRATPVECYRSTKHHTFQYQAIGHMGGKPCFDDNPQRVRS